jgi:hypothetical protein
VVLGRLLLFIIMHTPLVSVRGLGIAGDVTGYLRHFDRDEFYDVNFVIGLTVLQYAFIKDFVVM